MQKKIKRVKPLIITKKNERDIEALKLKELHEEKQQTMQELKRYEHLYIAGIDKINQERQSTSRDQLKILEDGVDDYKSKWYHHLQKLREIEIQEKAQIAQLINAEKGLKSMEKLDEKYKENLEAIRKYREQKQLDETAIKFHRNKRT